MQETYCTHDFIKEFNKNWQGKIIHSVSDSEHSKGVCIMIRKEFNINIINQHNCCKGRYLLLNVEIDGVGYTIGNIYAPNNVQDRITFYDMVRAKTTTHALYDNLLLGGNFNSVTSPGDRKTQKLDGTSSHLRRLFDDLHIRDAWREFNEVGTDFTYIDPSTAMRHSRIDLWLNSDSLKSMIKSCTVLQSPAPDHKAICLDVDVNSRPRGEILILP